MSYLRNSVCRPEAFVFFVMFAPVLTEACSPGMYGDLCMEKCPYNCANRICSGDVGYCLECVPGKYNDTCTSSCPEHCYNGTCHQKSGHCKECIHGRYGPLCELLCPANCEDSICMKETGYCVDCKIGSYGNLCTRTCPVTCKDFTCDQLTGYCDACYPGKYGVVCGADCPATCKNNLCYKDDGQCLEQKEVGTDYKSIAMIVLAVLMFISIIAVAVCLFRMKIYKAASKRQRDIRVTDPHYASIVNMRDGTDGVYVMTIS